MAAHGAVFAVWLTAAFAVAGSASGDRYPGVYLLWTGLLLAGGLILPLAVLAATVKRVFRSAPGEALAAAFCVLFAGALSLDVSPELRAGTRLGATRLFLLGACVALAGWNVRRARLSRLSLGTAMALLCIAWMLCGVLRAAGVPQTLSRPSILLPLAAAFALVVPGLPRLDPALSRFRQWATLAACAALALLPLIPRVPLPERRTGPAAGAAPPGGRSAVLIVLDTLRRDHMSLYGYPRKTTPALEQWAKSGMVFDDSSSTSSWTFPSHASMFTGLWPRSHGAKSFRGDKDQPVTAIYALAHERVTLAEIARAHGYRTASFAANTAFLCSDWGLDQGFEDYLCRQPRLPGLLLGTARDLAWKWDKSRAVEQERPYFTAPEMTRGVISWLERHRDVPFFLFVNYMDVHRSRREPRPLPFEERAPRRRKERPREQESADGDLAGVAMTPAERQSEIDEYDREVIRLDRWVSALLEYIERSGIGARTQVILTSDHGEFLGDHGETGHGKDLYAEVVNVPLIVWEPAATPGRVSRRVQGLDLFPTILRYLGLPIPEGIQGQPILEADHQTVSEQYYGRPGQVFSKVGDRLDRILRTIRSGEYRYFNSSTGEERLFHVIADPRETRNLVSQLPEVAASARRRLEEWTRSTPEAAPPVEPPRKADAETLENLRALGYVR